MIIQAHQVFLGFPDLHTTHRIKKEALPFFFGGGGKGRGVRGSALMAVHLCTSLFSLEVML